MEYVGNYEQREDIRNHIFNNKKEEFESFVLEIMGQMMEEFDFGYSMEFDVLLKKFFEFIKTFKVKKQIMYSLNIDFCFLYRFKMTEQEIQEFVEDFISSVINRIAVFIIQEGFMQRLSEAVLRCDYSIYEDEVNDVLLNWAPKRVEAISLEYGFEEN